MKSAMTYTLEDKNRVDHLDKYAADKYRKDSRREKSNNRVAFCEKADYKPLVSVSQHEKSVDQLSKIDD